MEHLEYPLFKVSDSIFKVFIDLRLYSKQAIVASAYKFSNKYSIIQKISCENENIVEIYFEAILDKKLTEADVKEFCNDLIDQQVRFNTESQFGYIRDLIVEEAFKPISK